jgi:xylulose-5-phosphate/fructose-6-phosphate phosphoketolase
LFNFHGYAITVKKLLFGHPHAGRFTISGYSEEGSTTTPFDMQCRNGTSRFHLVIAAMEKAGLNNKKYARKAKELIKKYQKKLQENRKYVEKNGVDLAEVVHWKWDN